MSYDFINDLRRKPDYYDHDGPTWIRSIWNTPSSFDWFLKNNRQQLLSEGAIHRLGRDYFIHRQRFPDVACRILGLSEGTQDPMKEGGAT